MTLSAGGPMTLAAGGPMTLAAGGPMTLAADEPMTLAADEPMTLAAGEPMTLAAGAAGGLGVPWLNMLFQRGLPSGVWFLAACVLGVGAWLETAKAGGEHLRVQEDLNFEADVLPLLETNCFACHGGKRTRAGLDLTSRAGALRGGDSGSVLNREDPGRSLLLKMTSYADEYSEMPPKGKLDDAALDLLRKWVVGGLSYGRADEVFEESTDWEADEAEDYEPELRKRDGLTGWSYQELGEPQVPVFSDAVAQAWVRNPIDAFLLRRMRTAGCEPNETAPALQLLRRLSYNLTGLAPDPQDVADFTSAPNQENYQAYVEQYLASKAYGERWARHWLDLVRYAETNGFERDGDKPYIWRYRDYVIEAFERDLPYDQFLTEQLAGDLLAEPTPDSMIATGYYRLIQWDDEPGAGALQGRYDNLADVLATTTSAFLGMSMGCARCHDHKGDALPTRDYYSLMACFHGVTDMSVDGYLQDISSPGEQAQRDRLMAEKASREHRLRVSLADLENRAVQRAWKSYFSSSKAGSSVLGNLSDLMGLRMRYFEGDWDGAAELLLPNISNLPGSSLLGEVEQNGQFHFENWFRAEYFCADYTARLRVPVSGRYSFAFESSHSARILVNGETVVEGRAAGQGAIDLEAGWVELEVQYVHRRGPAGLRLRWGASQTTPANAVEWRELSNSQASGPVENAPAFLESPQASLMTDTERESYQVQLDQLKSELQRQVPQRLAATVQEGQAEPMFVHIRGNAAVHGEPVQPGFPQVLAELAPLDAESPDETTPERLRVARWLVGKKAGPLTARVMVNRIWQHHFGRGLVSTPNDFGEFGERPSHPELLDWLAGEFIRSKWRVKHIQRLILDSAAFQMSSEVQGSEDPRHTVDPLNHLFWRASMRRLQAEELRDSILAVSGLLNRKSGGPSVYSRMPREALETASRPDAAWGTSPPEERNRRSIYIKVKRSLWAPMLENFDVADTDSSCPERLVTVQPTQALGLLNSEFIQEMAAALAQRLEGEVDGLDNAATSLGGDRARVEKLSEWVTGRAPTEIELQQSLELLTELQADYGQTHAEAWQDICLVYLNLNEFLYLD